MARVDKSDKVEAAGCVRCVMGKVQASASDIGLSFAGFAKFDRAAGRPLAFRWGLLRVLRRCFAWSFSSRTALNQIPALTGTLSVGSEDGQQMGVSSCGLLSWWCPGAGFLPAPECFDDAHRAAAVGTWFAQFQ